MAAGESIEPPELVSGSSPAQVEILDLESSLEPGTAEIEVALLTPCRCPALNRAAIEALRAWRYRPARRSGVIAEDSIIETILFRIGA